MKFLLILAICSAVLALSNGLKCYSCLDCDKVEEKFLKDCVSPLNGSCAKLTVKTDRQTTVARECYLKHEPGCKKEDNYGSESCFCNEDKCNNANSMSYSILALLAVCIVTVFSY